jgi:hypothetical protein
LSTENQNKGSKKEKHYVLIIRQEGLPPKKTHNNPQIHPPNSSNPKNPAPKKPPGSPQWFPASLPQIIFMDQPGYAKITEGFHDLSVDLMNTSFFLMNM